MQASLTETTRNLVLNRAVTLEVIAKETGTSEAWLSQFANAKRTRVDADVVQRVYEYLSGRTLIF